MFCHHHIHGRFMTSHDTGQAIKILGQGFSYFIGFLYKLVPERGVLPNVSNVEMNCAQPQPHGFNKMQKPIHEKILSLLLNV